MEIISSIISNVLMALYQPFWISIILTVTCTELYIIANTENLSGKGWKFLYKTWIKTFLQAPRFRKLTLLTFYSVMILFQTLLNRNMWLNPLSDVMGGWSFYKMDTATNTMKLTTENIENFILFMPFSGFLFWYLEQKDKLLCLLWKSLKIVFLCSLAIEFSQLFLRLGTFQFSDIFYNSVGGVAGGFIYWILYKINAYLQ